MSSTFNMVRYRRRTGVATYQTAVNVDNGGSVDWANGVAAIGASDRVHFFLRSNTGATLYQRTLSAANALEATATNIASPGAGAMHRNYALSYVDGATTKVRNSFQGATRVEVAKLDSTDTPTVTVETASDNISYNLVASVQYQQYLAIDPASLNLHLIYSRTSTQDLLYDYSTGGGGAWGTDTTELAATINHITANVYDRGGAGTKLAMVLDDAGTVKYAEIALAAGPVSVAMDAAAATLGASVATLDVPGGVTPSLIWNHYRPLHTLTSR